MEEMEEIDEVSLLIELSDLYVQGKTGEMLSLIQQTYGDDEYAMPLSVLVKKGWADYRRGEYGEAWECGQIATERDEDCMEAWLLLAQIAAYIRKDDALINEIAQRAFDHPGVWNAMAIRARDPDSSISVEMIISAAMRHFNNPKISAINLINNTGRLLFAKPRSEEDMVLALGFFQTAMAKYGKHKNFHHRAALCYWMSQLYLKMEDIDSAVECAKSAISLWVEQVALDPSNPEHKKRLQGALDHFYKLVGGEA